LNYSFFTNRFYWLWPKTSQPASTVQYCSY